MYVIKVMVAVEISLSQGGGDTVCNLRRTDGETITKKFTLILLKSHEEDIQRYFLELVYLLLRKLPSIPTISSLKGEPYKVISLFSSLPEL